MKRIFILLILVILLISCKPVIEAEPITETVPIVPEPIIEYIEVENTDRIDELELEVQRYQALIGNLNELLSNVYYVYDNNGTTYVFGTGFSLEYKGKYYLITAGHVVDGEWGIHKDLGFKDINNEWIYPKLLVYEVTKTTPDYAIFYSDKIDDGFKYDLNNTEPDYRLGINKPIQENKNQGIAGESGSAIIDLDGEVTGIYIGYLQDIDIVIEAIDNLE